ncbi:MAG: helix-turn-helix domain-containing protein [Erysipelotrichaceae bacterium]|nr:helix-turn-helix domain-containing protein [Erysipelotrichaceae bacterium]
MRKSRSYIATPPGATIKEQIIDRGMSQKEFALRMGLSEKHISKLINGDVQLTCETANKLEMVLGVPAGFWNSLEAIYREKLVKVKDENEMEADIQIAKRIPYSEMVKLGWVPAAGKPTEKVIHLRKFFAVSSLELLDNYRITQIACRRLTASEKSDLALMAWTQKAKIESRSVQTGPLNINGIKKIIPELRKMRVLPFETSQQLLQKKLADLGVVLICLPHLEGSFLQGAAFCEGSKIVIGMTVRGKDGDRFWFSLFHELGHIVLGHLQLGQPLTDDQEKAADLWAANSLISGEDYELFIKTGTISEESILRFAKEQKIDPGIVVCRLQSDKLISSSHLNHLKTQYTIQN